MGEDDVSELNTLFWALLFHQFFEGIFFPPSSMNTIWTHSHHTFKNVNEGVALGTCVSLSSLNKYWKLFFCLMFSIFFPIGIGIGTFNSFECSKFVEILLLISIFYFILLLSEGISILQNNSEVPSCENSAVLGPYFNAIAAGSLVYVSTVEMIAEDLCNEHVTKEKWSKVVIITGVILGATALAVLAKYA